VQLNVGLVACERLGETSEYIDVFAQVVGLLAGLVVDGFEVSCVESADVQRIPEVVEHGRDYHLDLCTLPIEVVHLLFQFPVIFLFVFDFGFELVDFTLLLLLFVHFLEDAVVHGFLHCRILHSIQIVFIVNIQVSHGSGDHRGMVVLVEFGVATHRTEGPGVLVGRTGSALKGRFLFIAADVCAEFD